MSSRPMYDGYKSAWPLVQPSIHIGTCPVANMCKSLFSVANSDKYLALLSFRLYIAFSKLNLSGEREKSCTVISYAFKIFPTNFGSLYCLASTVLRLH